MSKSPNILTCSIRRRARLGESGMSLLELMIAMTVLTVGMLGSMVMILTAMESNSRNKTDNLATILDQEVMEKFATLNNYPKAGSATIYDCALKWRERGCAPRFVTSGSLRNRKRSNS